MENSSVQKLTFDHHCETQSSLQMRDQELEGSNTQHSDPGTQSPRGTGSPLEHPQQTVFSICDLIPIHGEPHCVRRHQILVDIFLRKSLVMFTDSICVCGQFCDKHQADNI